MAVKKKKGSIPDEREAHGHEITGGNNLLQTVINASLTGIAYLKPTRNGAREIIDFECVFANNKGMLNAGCNDMVGKKYSELFPGVTEKEIFRKYIKALEDNTVQDFELQIEMKDPTFGLESQRSSWEMALSLVQRILQHERGRKGKS